MAEPLVTESAPVPSARQTARGGALSPILAGECSWLHLLVLLFALAAPVVAPEARPCEAPLKALSAEELLLTRSSTQMTCRIPTLKQLIDDATCNYRGCLALSGRTTVTWGEGLGGSQALFAAALPKADRYHGSTRFLRQRKHPCAHAAGAETPAVRCAADRRGCFRRGRAVRACALARLWTRAPNSNVCAGANASHERACGPKYAASISLRTSKSPSLRGYTQALS